MEYLSIHEMSEKWNIKERKLTSLCREDRISGARKLGKEWMIPSDAIKPLDKRTKEFEKYKIELEEVNTSIPYSISNIDEKITDYFIEKYNEKPMYTSFTPYKICPIGAHVDHNLGCITGFAIDKGIHITDAMPVSDAIGKTYEATDAKDTGTVADDGTGVFDFSVTATITGTTTISYDIVAVKQTEAKELDGKYVKLYLEKNETSASGEYEQVAAPKRWTTKDEDTGLAEVSGALTDAAKEVENAKLLHSDSFSGTGGNHYYRLRMWVADDYGEDEASAAAMGEARSFSVKVDVYGQAGA